MAAQTLREFPFVSQSIRVVLIDDEPWFVAKDVASALDLTWSGNRIAHVPEEWRGMTSVVTPSGNQQMAIISEQGLYFFLGRSDKPKALPFQKWIAGEVLPTLRKTGQYVAPDFVAEELINGAQVAEIKHLVWQLGKAYHMPNGGEWAAFALVRESFGVQHTYRLPARHYPEALALLQWAERLSSEFKHRVIEIERKFLKSRFKVCPPELDRLADEIPGLLLRP